MKKQYLRPFFSSVISAPAFAANGNDLADANLVFNMDNSQIAELAVLSEEEMKAPKVPYSVSCSNSLWRRN